MAQLAERTIRTALTHWRRRGVDADFVGYLDAFADDEGRTLLAELRRLVRVLAVPSSHALDDAYLAAAAGGSKRLDKIFCSIVAARLGRGILAEWKQWRKVFPSPSTPLRPWHVRRIAAYSGAESTHPRDVEELAKLVERADRNRVEAGEVLRRVGLQRERRGYVFDAVAAWRTRRMAPSLLSRLADELGGLTSVSDKVELFERRLPLLADLATAIGGEPERLRLRGVAAIWIADLFAQDLALGRFAGGANPLPNSPMLGYASAFRRTFGRAPLPRALEAVLSTAMSAGVELPVLVDGFVCASQCLAGNVSAAARARLADAVARTPNSIDGGAECYAMLMRWSRSPVRRRRIVGRIAESAHELVRNRDGRVSAGSVLREVLPVFLWDVITSGAAERASLRFRREHLRQALRLEGCPNGLIELVTQTV